MIVLQEPITLYHRTEVLPIPKIEVRRNNHEEVCLRYSDDGNGALSRCYCECCNGRVYNL